MTILGIMKPKKKFLESGFLMSRIILKNNGALRGEVTVSGSKNSALPILAATILTRGKNQLWGIPALSDIEIMYTLLESLGAELLHLSDHVLIDTAPIRSHTTPYELVTKMRGSFLLAGPLLAACKKACICLPGGCPIGSRPVDLHLKGFAQLGASITQEHGYITLACEKLTGAKIYLDFPSVGATENLIMAACLADGETLIQNAATEPEIEDLANFLNRQGAKISGAGTDTVHILGVDRLSGCSHTVISDRIEAGTYMAAFAISHGKGRVKNIQLDHIRPMIAKLREMGVEIAEEPSAVLVNARKKLRATNIKTMPFPGFPTDMQAQFGGLLSVAQGTGMIVETVFENRFLHVGELQRMGANIRIDGRTSVVQGVGQLTGAEVQASDLRGGAALVLAGLCAGGVTKISGVEHIERGYENLVGKLQLLGADITLED